MKLFGYLVNLHKIMCILLMFFYRFYRVGADILYGFLLYEIVNLLVKYNLAT